MGFINMKRQNAEKKTNLRTTIIKNSKYQCLLDGIMLLAGTGLAAFAIQCIYEPMHLIIGGFSGISIIIKNLTGKGGVGGIPVWFTNIALNIPLFLVAYRIEGKKVVLRAVLGTVLSSVWLFLIPAVNLPQGDYMIAAILGGVLSGAGMGLILRAKTTTGGTETLATLIHHYLRQYSTVQLILVLNGMIVLGGMYVFGFRAAMYALVAIFISGRVTNGITEGFKFSKVTYIITGRYKEVAERIMKELRRGVTGLRAEGMYSGEEKCMLYCVVSPKEIVRVKEIVAAVDESAFVIVSDAREVFGKGFLRHF